MLKIKTLKQCFDPDEQETRASLEGDADHAANGGQ